MKAKKKAKAPKPVAAWGIARPDGRFVLDPYDMPKLFGTRRAAAYRCGDHNGCRPVRVLVTVAPAPRRTAK